MATRHWLAQMFLLPLSSGLFYRLVIYNIIFRRQVPVPFAGAIRFLSAWGPTSETKPSAMGCLANQRLPRTETSNVPRRDGVMAKSLLVFFACNSVGKAAQGNRLSVVLALMSLDRPMSARSARL